MTSQGAEGKIENGREESVNPKRGGGLVWLSACNTSGITRWMGAGGTQNRHTLDET